ncbi:MAG: hypothetical protein A2Y45_03940 [Tenericutes bacterium GWC2_34_14]|nr:MAG: hypothetical protein A2Z84_04940 [Tenericutes bacterium GWA2_35_7]OHE28758.1 MAG: hypothetical protein A2Y45_03940 [Tenericutes bacterium GWC2_34_14]OHE33226.1 MAG: hypothetical protein A2012_05720 [Tenericutes bacterium GWE2_34_108]OHE36376.1 MAG: hypothetical protein A2Y46_07825 [Tenericutes bacterium GWF1_35_14]OHE37580.1 MAG: hypothetical protein A2Y44_02750 [Tenericutes bacterium GWF2_35_184]OHE45143.1 MAG: hypothetical protein A2221_02760 [Tenericutes bacterium RIFOXYA2_FULL_36_3
MKKVVILLFMLLSVLTLSSCQFSTHGEIYDDINKWTSSGDTYSFLGRYETNNEISFNRFSGLYTIKSFTEENDFTVTIDLSISSGRFSCFIVTENDEIIELVDGINTITSQSGRMRLRMVADDAKGSISYSIN